MTTGFSGAARPPLGIEDKGPSAADENEDEAAEKAASGAALLRAAIDSLPHHFWITDAAGRYIEQNAIDRSVFGELIGRRAAAVTPPVEIEARWRDAHRRVLAGEAVRFVASRPAVYGRAEVEVAMSPLIVDGTVRGAVGLTVDRTEIFDLARSLEASEARLADYLATASDWLWETDAEHRLTALTGCLENALVSPDQFIGRRRWEVVGADPEADPLWREHLADLEARRSFRGFVYAYASADLPATWIELCGKPLFDPDGSFRGYRGTARNVTERRTAELALREAHAKLEAMAKSGLIGVTAGRGFKIEEANDAFLAMLGLDRSALDGGLDWRELVPSETVAEEEAVARSLAFSGAVYTTETRYSHRNGALVPVLLNIVVLDGDAQRWFALVQDLTPMKLAEARMRELAERDTLTGLANRHVLFDRLEGDFAERRSPGAISALLLLDLDGFKAVNDTLGHAAGDRLLQAVAARLGAVLRDSDTIARVGGDEFALVLRGLQSPSTAADMALKILDSLAEPLPLDGRLIRPAGSIGISLLPADGRDAAELMRMADIALYQAKAAGGGRFCFFEPALLDVIERRRRIVEALETAIAEEAFSVALQPLVRLADGAWIGVEALVRWQLDGMPLQPDAFIGVAAECGCIVPLGRIVRSRALAATARLAAAGRQSPGLAINVHVIELKQPGFADELADLLAAHGLPPEKLEVEITEAALLDRDAEAVGRSLDALRRLGVTITLDDFGTGYASLTQLKRFPVDRLKIDRSVIRDIGVDPGDAVLVKGIIDLAHTLELEVVAEGVETAEQLAFLVAQGCDFAQGYGLAAPQTVDELLASRCGAAGHPAVDSASGSA